MNPVTDTALVAAGDAAGLDEAATVIDFGCGNATALILFAGVFGASGTGIEARPDACDTARAVAAEAGCDDAIDIICADAGAYRQEAQADLAVALGASHIWGSIPEALAALAAATGNTGRVLFGERYWKTTVVPPEFAREWPEIQSEYEILTAARNEGYDLAWVWHAPVEEWDRYESAIWHNCLTWVQDHPDDPRSADILDYMRTIQEEYLAFGREHIGWGLYLLTPTGI
jgi:SAM-dependent methyltransferase